MRENCGAGSGAACDDPQSRRGIQFGAGFRGCAMGDGFYSRFAGIKTKKPGTEAWLRSICQSTLATASQTTSGTVPRAGHAGSFRMA